MNSSDHYIHDVFVASISPQAFRDWLYWSPYYRGESFCWKTTAGQAGLIVTVYDRLILEAYEYAESRGVPSPYDPVISRFMLIPLSGERTLVRASYYEDPAGSEHQAVLDEARRLFVVSGNGVDHTEMGGSGHECSAEVRAAQPGTESHPPKANSRKPGRPIKTTLTEGEQRDLDTYLAYLERRIPPTRAADLVGHDADTMKRWRRIAEQANTKKGS